VPNNGYSGYGSLNKNGIMKIEELRIGNWVKHNSSWCYRGEDVIDFMWDTSDWYALGECTLFMENIEPIQLTEEWLFKFGFFKHNNAYVLNKPKINSLMFNFSIWQDMTYNSSEFPIELESVHQLQNLYFAITGTELAYENKTK